MKFFANFLQRNQDYSDIGSFDIGNTLTFGTQLNGGFAGAAMSINMPRLQGSAFARNALGSIVEVRDLQGRWVYDGRVSGARSEGGVVKITATGLWEDGARISVPTALWLDPLTTAGDVIQDCIDLVPEWNVGINVSNMDVQVGAQDYNDEQKVNTMIQDMLKPGYTTSAVIAAYIAIYNKGVAEIVYEQKPYGGSDFTLSAGSGHGTRVAVALDINKVFNKIYALYDDPAEDSVGPTLHPTPAEDLASQWKYGIREGVLNVGEYGVGIGLDLRDLAIQKYAQPYSSGSATSEGWIRDNSGAYLPNYMLRSGDFVMIINNDENAVGHDFNENVANGFVTGTNYTASNNSNKISISTGDKKLEYLLARLGLSGGLG